MIDQEKIQGLSELIKLLLALTTPTAMPPVMPMPQLPPSPQAPPAHAPDAASSLLRAAEVIERGGAQAREAIRHGMEDARTALLQLAKARDLEQQALLNVGEALAKLTALQSAPLPPSSPPATASPSSAPSTPASTG